MKRIFARDTFDSSDVPRDSGAKVRAAIDEALINEPSIEVTFEGVSTCKSYLDEIFAGYDNASLKRIQATGLSFVGREQLDKILSSTAQLSA